MKLLITVSTLLLMFGCAVKPVKNPVPAPIGQDPEPTKEIDTFPYKCDPDGKPLKWNNEYYDYALDQAINKYGQDLLSFSNNKQCWKRLFVAMAKFESNFKTDLQFKENFKDRFGNYVISRGLFQLSYESGLGYRCDLSKPQDLHDHSKNIDCAVRIMSRWVAKDKCISCKEGSSWRGGARYWSVLRYKLDQIKEYI